VSVKENLSLDEFATAPRRQRLSATLAPAHNGSDHPGTSTGVGVPSPAGPREIGETVTEGSKALRQMKRARMKGASHFVNVNLDRDTKRRLKLASFNMETSMQALMEKAIRQYLDTNGF